MSFCTRTSLGSALTVFSMLVLSLACRIVSGDSAEGRERREHFTLVVHFGIHPEHFSWMIRIDRDDDGFVFYENEFLDGRARGFYSPVANDTNKTIAERIHIPNRKLYNGFKWYQLVITDDTPNLEAITAVELYLNDPFVDERCMLAEIRSDEFEKGSTAVEQFFNLPASNSPANSCIGSQAEDANYVTIVIQMDSKAHQTGWKLCEDVGARHKSFNCSASEVIASRRPGYYRDMTRRAIQERVPIMSRTSYAGSMRYRFQTEDAGGNGLSSGYFRVYLGEPSPANLLLDVRHWNLTGTGTTHDFSINASSTSLSYPPSRQHEYITLVFETDLQETGWTAWADTNEDGEFDLNEVLAFRSNKNTRLFDEESTTHERFYIVDRQTYSGDMEYQLEVTSTGSRGLPGVRVFLNDSEDGHCLSEARNVPLLTANGYQLNFFIPAAGSSLPPPFLFCKRFKSYLTISLSFSSGFDESLTNWKLCKDSDRDGSIDCAKDVIFSREPGTYTNPRWKYLYQVPIMSRSTYTGSIAYRFEYEDSFTSSRFGDAFFVYLGDPTDGARLVAEDDYYFPTITTAELERNGNLRTFVFSVNGTRPLPTLFPLSSKNEYITVVIHFDDNPNEMGWTLFADVNQDGVFEYHEAIAAYLKGYYADFRRRSTIRERLYIVDRESYGGNVQYLLEVKDKAADGFQSGASMKVYLNEPKYGQCLAAITSSMFSSDEITVTFDIAWANGSMEFLTSCRNSPLLNLDPTLSPVSILTPPPSHPAVSTTPSSVPSGKAYYNNDDALFWPSAVPSSFASLEGPTSDGTEVVPSSSTPSTGPSVAAVSTIPSFVPSGEAYYYDDDAIFGPSAAPSSFASFEGPTSDGTEVLSSSSTSSTEPSVASSEESTSMVPTSSASVDDPNLPSVMPTSVASSKGNPSATPSMFSSLEPLARVGNNDDDASFWPSAAPSSFASLEGPTSDGTEVVPASSTPSTGPSVASSEESTSMVPTASTSVDDSNLPSFVPTSVASSEGGPSKAAPSMKPTR